MSAPLLTLGSASQTRSAADRVRSGERVTVTNEPYNSLVAPGASVTVGFTGSYSSSNAAPAAFAVNGTACST